MELSIQHNLDAFNSAFKEYLEWTSKTPQEALEHKVRDIGIKLYQGFTSHQFGGVPRQRGIATSELAARTAEKRGTMVRGELLAQYEAQKATLQSDKKRLKKELVWFDGSHKGWKRIASALANNAVKRIGIWQQIVGKEIALRQAGIGELGAAFLWYRTRGKGENRHLVLNRTGKPMGEVTVGEGEALIVGEVAGLTTVDAKYGVVAAAIDTVTDDTIEYIQRKHDEEASRIFGGLAA